MGCRPYGAGLDDSLENQLNVAEETPIFEIIEIDFYLVRPDDIIVIPFRVRLLGEQFFLVAILNAGRSGDAWAELKDASVVTFQLVGIAWHIGAWPDEAHLPNQNIDQFRKAIHFAMAQPMADARDARVARYRDAVALGLFVHGAELADMEGFTIFPDARLHEKQRAFRVQFDEYGNNEQRQKQYNKSHECHDSIEAPFEEESYFVFIFRHAAWPPC